MLSAKARNSTSQNSQKAKKYKCDKCKDCGFIEVPRDTKQQPLMRICICQQKEKVEKQWTSYGVNPKSVKKIADYETCNDKLLERAKNLALNYVFKIDENKNWISFLGQSGAGKSHLAKAIGAMLLKKKYEVVYMPYSEIVMELKRNVMNQQEYNRILNRFMYAEVLVIDDLFKEKVINGALVAKLGEADLRHIYPLLNYRYNNDLRTIISSEATLAMLKNLDEALLGRILEKCGENIVVFEGGKYNHRFKSLSK